MSNEFSSSNKLDMVNGSIWNKMIAFAIPIALSSILQQLFNSADVAVVGHFAGSNALAAVGNNVVTVGLAINIVVGFSIGPNVVLSRLIGEGKEEEANKVVRTSLFIAFSLGLLFLFLGQVFATVLLHAISTPESMMGPSALYFRIYICGMPFMALYNFGAALLRSSGDTKRPLLFLVISGLLNVGLNLFFVICLNMSVAGVALATVLSNVISSFLMMRALFKDRNIHLDKKLLSPNMRYVRIIIMEGAPASIQSAVFSISNLFVQSAVNSFGEIGIAGSSAGMNAEYIIFSIITGFSQAAVTFGSQNFGARKIDRIKKTFWIAELENLIFSGLLCFLFFLIRYPFVSIFSSDSDVIEFAVKRILFVGIFEFMTGFYEVAGGCLRAIGHPLLPSILTMIGSVFFRITWIYIVFAHFKTFESLVVVYPASWLFNTIMMFIAYYIMMRKLCGSISHSYMAH